MQIRNARLEDLDILLQFELGIIEAERPFDATMKTEHFHYYDIKEMLTRDDCAIVVAEEDEKLVGSGSARVLEGKTTTRTPPMFFRIYVCGSGISW
ncbi:hypothetical protein [Niabella hibiscisoli]|uniref:hypothetical protein n=1 Tax=Niabella hibiscisoli TaxID=1825928 RepID=UPI001F111FCA|nr:hypothetical protein [Niabella hibiscisoli]MCH5718859.1 hypothetical protein [Niabella hibiscisoli]